MNRFEREEFARIARALESEDPSLGVLGSLRSQPIPPALIRASALLGVSFGLLVLGPASGVLLLSALSALAVAVTVRRWWTLLRVATPGRSPRIRFDDAGAAHSDGTLLPLLASVSVAGGSMIATVGLLVVLVG